MPASSAASDSANSRRSPSVVLTGPTSRNVLLSRVYRRQEHAALGQRAVVVADGRAVREMEERATVQDESELRAERGVASPVLCGRPEAGDGFHAGRSRSEAEHAACGPVQPVEAGSVVVPGDRAPQAARATTPINGRHHTVEHIRVGHDVRFAVRVAAPDRPVVTRPVDRATGIEAERPADRHRWMPRCPARAG